MDIYSKQELIEKLKEISEMEWVENARYGNHGGVGNTLEDLLGIKENNLPIPNAAEWELKCQRRSTKSLMTLTHCEPSPRAIKFVPSILLPSYGWRHKEAGKKHSENEMSFRQTIHGLSPSDRGFMVKINRDERKILISFDSTKVSKIHRNWLDTVNNKVGNINELAPQPYWGFDDLEHIVGVKLLNCFYVQAEVKKQNGKEFYRYSSVLMLRKFNFNRFLDEIEKGNILIDFDARTGHNHGTKFRLRRSLFPNLYEEATVIIG
ncbi:MAG: MvaI/BcnI restriction endonuclease family protein [Ignavibacteriae bacterium]|nr:MvaI/BcnI restriction endonuclease family protein [Ignavibacteriota bacterium]